MSSFKISGILGEIRDSIVVGNGFQKQEFVLKTQEQYPQTLLFEVQGQNVDNLLNGYFTGEEVELDFNLNGRSWDSPEGNRVYFKTLVCWKITKLANCGKGNTSQTPVDDGNDADDLPF